MGFKAKFNQSKKNSAAEKVASCLEEITNVESKITQYTSKAGTESSKWPKEEASGGEVSVKSEPIKETRYDDDNVPYLVEVGTNYWTNFDSTKHRDDKTAAVNAGISKCNSGYVTPYMEYCDTLDNKWVELKTYLTTRLENISNCLTAIETAATTFDGLSSNISSALAELEAAGLADNIAVETVDGVEVMYYQIYDENGNVIGKYSISEMVNAFYTYAGSAMAAAYSTALMYGDGNIPEGYLNNIISGVGNNVYSMLDTGFMSVVTLDGIEAMYNAVIGDGAWSTLTDEYTSLLDGKITDDKTVSDFYGGLLNDKTNALLSAGATFAAGTAARLGTDTYSEKNAEEASERLAKHENKPADTEPETEAETEAETEPGTEAGTTPTTETPQKQWPQTDPTNTPGGPSSDPSNPGDTGDTGESTDNPTTGDENGDGLVDIVETELPSEPLEVEVTNEDIDSLARDEFYEKYSVPEDLAARRQQDIDAFEELFNSENRDALVEKFIEMGYDPAEALGAANNKDVGLAAYLLGSQNQELTQIAKEFASDLGLGDAFDTSYDNAPDYMDLFDGDAQVELTSPTSSEAIVSAKTDVTEAKTAYTEAVNNANQYIQDATKAKGELETIRASIESVSGTDTSKWTDEQVSQYNKATEAYNTAVTKANEEVAAAEKAKTAYTEAKENLQKVEEEYYKEIREAIQKQNGYADESGTNGTTSTEGTTGTEGATGTTTQGSTNNMTGTSTLENGTTNTQDSEQSLIDQLFVNM